MSATYGSVPVTIWYADEVPDAFTLLDLKGIAVETLSKVVDHFPNDPAWYNVLACTDMDVPTDRLTVLVRDRDLARAVQVALASPSRALDIDVVDKRKLHFKIERRVVRCAAAFRHLGHACSVLGVRLTSTRHRSSDKSVRLPVCLFFNCWTSWYPGPTSRSI